MSKIQKTFILIFSMTAASCVNNLKTKDTYYLILYSSRYEETKKDKIGKVLCALLIKEGEEFHLEIPHNYEPSIIIHGTLNRKQNGLFGELVITLQDPGIGYHHIQNTLIPFGKMIPVKHSDEEFHFEIQKDESITKESSEFVPNR